MVYIIWLDLPSVCMYIYIIIYIYIYLFIYLFIYLYLHMLRPPARPPCLQRNCPGRHARHDSMVDIEVTVVSFVDIDIVMSEYGAVSGDFCC